MIGGEVAGADLSPSPSLPSLLSRSQALNILLQVSGICHPPAQHYAPAPPRGVREHFVRHRRPLTMDKPLYGSLRYQRCQYRHSRRAMPHQTLASFLLRFIKICRFQVSTRLVAATPEGYSTQGSRRYKASQRKMDDRPSRASSKEEPLDSPACGETATILTQSRHGSKQRGFPLTLRQYNFSHRSGVPLNGSPCGVFSPSTTDSVWLAGFNPRRRL
jgi:hypothetical protein